MIPPFMPAPASTSTPRTILVTGANRGLGLATTERLARAGHRLVLTARDDAKARATADRIEQARAGAVVAAHAVDLTSLAAVRELAARLVARGQPIDVLVHNAGMLFPAERRVLTEDGIEACLLEDAADGLARLFGQTPLDEPGGRYFTHWAVGESSEQSRDRAQVQRFWRWACARAGVSEEVEEGE